MSVYEHTYKPYEGALTSARGRALVIPRHAMRGLFASKILTACFALSFLPPLVFAILIYLHHNLNAVQMLQIDLAEVVPINTSFFHTFLLIQCAASFFLTLLVAPPLVARDLTNNALPLYLSRPLSRFEYCIGKMAVVLGLTSLVTWIPAVALFLLQSYLQGARWMFENLLILGALIAGSLIWIVFLALLSITFSAWFRWRVAASGGMVAAFLIPAAIAGAYHNLFLDDRFYQTNEGSWANIISPLAIFNTIWESLFKLPFADADFSLPVWGAWLGLALMCAALVWLLSRKVKAYEIA